MNEKIRVPQVRCVAEDGSMLGVLPTERARALAREQGLDLVEISPRAEPPVCRIMDFGKFRYEEQRKERMARKKQHALAMKEIKFHANVEEHDYQTKVNNIKKFLEKGHKVKLSLFFRGRENVHQELGFNVISRVFKDCTDFGQVDMAPKLLGRSILAMIAPRAVKPVGVGGKPAEAEPRAPAQPRPAEPAPSQSAAPAPQATPQPQGGGTQPPPASK